MRVTAEEREEAVARLKEILKPGDTVYTILRHVSRSGMTRVICPLVVKDNRPIMFPRLAAKVLGERYDPDRYGVVVHGCGMDMGFHLVYELAHALFGNGYALDHRWL